MKYDIIATHKITKDDAVMMFDSIKNAKFHNPDFVDFRIIGVHNGQKSLNDYIKK